MIRYLSFLFVIFSSGCAIALPSFPTAINRSLPLAITECGDPKWPWHEAGDVVVGLSLSGGGKRAAAFAYGVMLGLQEVTFNLADGRRTNLLDQVDYVTAVSGGATAATFYTLVRGSQSNLVEFERFLHDNTEQAIIRRTLNPLNWLTSSAVIQGEYFSDALYNNKTFADLPRWPYLLIGATDLSRGIPFNFSRAQFACIGSDLASYPLGSAVAASAAYPMFFGTIPLQNFSYKLDTENKKRGPFLALSDGGLVDNLAIRNYVLLLNRGYLVGDHLETFRKRARAFIFIQVDGSAHLQPGLEETPTSPGLFTRMGRALEVVFEQQVGDINSYLSRVLSPTLDDLGVQYALLDLALTDAPSRIRQQVLEIPTRWTLDKQDIALLVEAGKDVVRSRSETIQKIRVIFQANSSPSPK